MSRSQSVIAPIMILLLAMSSIQFGATLAKQILPIFGAAGTTGLRLLFAAIILSAICQPWRRTIEQAAFKPIICYGLTVGAMNLLIYMALLHIPLGIAVALEFSGPLGIAIYASRKLIDFVWIALAMIGIALLLPIAPFSVDLKWEGIIYALLAGFCWALYIIYGSRSGLLASSSTVTTIGTLVAACAILPIAITTDGAMMLNYSFWHIALAVAILSSALPYWLEMIALKQLPTKVFGIFMSLEPAVAAMFGAIMLGEMLNWVQWLAMACIMIASAGCAVSHKQQSITPTVSA